MKNFILGIVSTSLIMLISYCAYPYLKSTDTTVKNVILPNYSIKYNIKSDIEKDVKSATIEAKKNNKNILLFVGGEWCKWCRALDKYLDTHKELQSTIFKNYKVVKAYYGGNMSKKNKDYLNKFPKIQGTPHIYVLDQNGKFVYSQGTGYFEDGSSYNLKKIKSFLEKYIK